MSLLPPNSYIIPVDTRSTIKSIILPDVRSNPGRFLVFKDVYGNANISSIYLSTLSNNFFEQSWSNTFIGNTRFGAWTLTNDGISRWIFTNIYSSNLYLYKQSRIVTDGLLFNYQGFTYTSNGSWQDSLGLTNLSSGIGLAAPSIGLDNERQNVPAFNGINQFFRAFTPVTTPTVISTFSYNAWFYTGASAAGCMINEAINPSTNVSSLSINVCGTQANTVRTGFRADNGFVITTIGAYTPNQWNNVSWTFNSTILRQYVNGVFTQQATTYTKSTQSIFYPVMGMGNPGISQIASPNQWPGILGSVRLYSTTLTQGQVIQNYNAEAYRYGLTQYPGTI